MVSANPKVVDNDRDEITVTLDGKEIRGWSYASEAERRTKMLAAREFSEGWFQAMEKSAAPEMLEALKAIASLGGNLPDSAIENVGGINEGRSRGIMYATARQIATAAIAKAEGQP